VESVRGDSPGLFITRYSPDFGLSEKEIIREVGLPKLATIPHDAVVAEMVINTHTPFVLTDDGPLGDAMHTLAANYLPQLAEKRQRGRGLAGLFSGVKQALVKES
jgi:hypothetical protein